MKERIYDWSFCGQVTHERRRQCIEQLRKLPKGKLVETDGFGRGLEHEEYFRILTQSKIVPCPCGPATPDTYRMCEALEAGAVPIIDTVSLPGIHGYWEMTLPDHPLPFVNEWSELPAVMETVLNDYERIQRLCQYWWMGYKLRFRNWLAEDLAALGVTE